MTRILILTLALGGPLHAAPAARVSVVATPSLGARIAPLAAPVVGLGAGALPTTPGLAPSAPSIKAPAGAPNAQAIAPAVEAMAAMPEALEAGGSAAYGGGAKLEDAMTGRKSFSGAGDAVNAAAPSGPSAELSARIKEKSAVLAKVREEISKVIVGQEEMVESIIMAMIANEHILLEGVPGVAKTQTVKAFGDAVDGQFQRVQGTPDKLPSDILGAEILQEDPATGQKSMKLEQGPIFTNILLVDEINRMMPKTQSALLEAMQERRVTIGRQTLELPKPFLLLATQNPIEQEGTYRLPEAQQDRFMFKVLVNRPTQAQLKEIMKRYATAMQPKAGKVTSLDEMAEARALAEQVHASDAIVDYITSIVEATHDPKSAGLKLDGMIENGASPRAGIFLLKAAKINAFLAGRAYVLPQDVRAVAPLVLRHRVMLSYQAGALTPDQVVERILMAVPLPRSR